MISPAAAVRVRLRRALAAACVAAAVVVAAAPVEAAAPARTANGVLRGVTTITWSGAAGIRLQVPRTVTIPESGYRLTQRGARFMIVRMVEGRQLQLCRRREMCGTASLDWFADLAEAGGNVVAPPPYDPGADHVSRLGDPPIVERGTWDLYLFTDGVATLEIRAKGLPGRVSYRAGGGVRGQAKRLPVRCDVSPCDPKRGVAETFAYGGDTFDVGPIGYAQAIAYARRPSRSTQGMGHNQPVVARACPYPNQFDPDASREPDDHPYGCDPVPEHPGNGGEWAWGTLNIANFGVGAGRWAGDTLASGRTYLGYQVGTVETYPGDPPTRYAGYGVWFGYGIRGAR